jgi:predicted site-specific integrase-resolvase
MELYTVLAQVDISAEQARLGIWVTAILTIVNVIANIASALYNKHNSTKLELARISAQSAERIALATQKRTEQSHHELVAKVDEAATVAESTRLEAQKTQQVITTKVNEIKAALPGNGIH